MSGITIRFNLHFYSSSLFFQLQLKIHVIHLHNAVIILTGSCMQEISIPGHVTSAFKSAVPKDTSHFSPIFCPRFTCEFVFHFPTSNRILWLYIQKKNRSTFMSLFCLFLFKSNSINTLTFQWKNNIARLVMFHWNTN